MQSIRHFDKLTVRSNCKHAIFPMKNKQAFICCNGYLAKIRCNCSHSMFIYFLLAHACERFDAVCFFFFSRHCNPCGLWPAQLSLSILSRKVFNRGPLPAARQTPNLEDQWLERSNYRYQVSLTSETTRANLSSGRWNYGREFAENFAESGDFHITIGFFYMP